MFKEEFKAEIQSIIENVPTLYKYIDFNGGQKLLSNSTLLIRNPSKFYDPYDCHPNFIDFDKMPDDYIKYLINKYNPQLNKNERGEKNQTIIKGSKQHLIELLKNGFIESERKSRGITCFSKNNNNLLMWSQYANSHKGICIGFDLEKLYRGLKKKNSYSEVALLQVFYTKDFISNDFYDDSFKAIINWLRTKSELWIYEEEIRISFGPIEFYNTDFEFVLFDKSAINEIYLGSQILKNHEKQIIEFIELSYPNIDLYKMELNSNSFKLTHKDIKKCL